MNSSALTVAVRCARHRTNALASFLARAVLDPDKWNLADPDLVWELAELAERAHHDVELIDILRSR